MKDLCQRKNTTLFTYEKKYKDINKNIIYIIGFSVNFIKKVKKVLTNCGNGSEEGGNMILY